MKKSLLLSLVLATVLLLNSCGSEPQKDQGVQDNTGVSQTENGSGEGLSEEDKTTGTEEVAENKEEEREFTGISYNSIGDTVTFGGYEQDNDTKNGTELIEWVVLDTDGENVLLLSKYGLDAQAYNTSGETVTWENSTLRRWLNETFYEAAFNEAERQAIITVTNVNPDNERWGTSGGNDTEDMVFLLSIGETETYFADRNDTLWTEATPYAVQQGAFVSDDGCSPWWLRSPGDDNDGGFCAAYVDYPPTGVVLSGYAAERNSRVVRPAVWVKTGTVGSGN